MDSAGIGVVLGRYKKLVKTGGRICISGCSPHVARLLEMAGVFSLVQQADTQDAGGVDAAKPAADDRGGLMYEQ